MVEDQNPPKKDESFLRYYCWCRNTRIEDDDDDDDEDEDDDAEEDFGYGGCS